MANPNVAIRNARAKIGKDPKVVQAANERMMADPMVVDMGKFQRGEMSAKEFQRKWQR